MKVNGYTLDIVCANAEVCSGIAGHPELTQYMYGDIYDSQEECEKEHPDDPVMYGYYLSKDGEETPDWFDTIEEAVEWAQAH